MMLYSKKDKGLQSYFIQSSSAIKAIKDLRWRNLEALINYSEGSECRHGEILTYYKDSQRIGRCGHCDNCDPQSTRRILEPVKIEKVVLRTKSQKSKASTKNSVAHVLDSEQESRFQALRAWRKEKATELDLPAFVVFSDRTLRDLAVQNPQTLEELRSIHGIGESKLEKFGWDLLAELSMR
jgi:ATP-dependent DNA helicase RecQ